jgi:hypothetical protein
LRRADIAMYQAKKSGRDQIVLSDTFPPTEGDVGPHGVVRSNRRRS